ncbi:tRNA(Met) cytidine acetyltransferase TmcA [Paraneptunicella aestuarii]|uniref:tRNA(Met) cytidine acetyltransferase TmcA n=1 Tax=Paraneptunicella aestuarii TaxID=2831148 RepID=UPI001E54F9F4|nr:GNAT family N-acetyltransferase [Paraneptunicella aestuarii]
MPVTTMLTQQIQNWVNRRLAHPCHRQLVVISGEQSWAIETAYLLIEQLGWNKENTGSIVSVGISHPDSDEDRSNAVHISNKQYRQYLGQETQCVIYNAWAGTRANALSALSGTIKQSGLMILLCPDFQSWGNYKDPELKQRISYGFEDNFQHSYFVQWLVQHIEQDPHCLVITPIGISGGQGQPAPLQNILSTQKNAPQPPCITNDQQQAVDAIIKVATGHRNRPLIMQADRGRGKSSAIGIASAKLASENNKNIILTAPTKSCCEQSFHWFETLGANTNALNFWAVDALIEQQPSADLVIIDEAAAIPVEQLKQICALYKRVVFSSTIHGYEGSGRGFEIRFKQHLKQQFPEYREIALQAPIRWSENDPLEQFWFQVLAYTQPDNSSSDLNDYIGMVTAQELINNPPLLYQSFSLLVNAHYQTSPDTIASLLDSPDQHVFISVKQGNVLATAIVALEGGSRLSDIAEHIAFGERRPNGHLLAQKLSSTLNMSEVATKRFARIVRIAVQPAQQHQGLGTELLTEIVQWAEKKELDFVGASFGAEPELLQFWQKNHFQLVFLGLKKETATGEYNALVLRSLHSENESIIASLENALQRNIKFHLSNTYRHLSYPMVLSILQSLLQIDDLDETRKAELEYFASGKRPLSLSREALFVLALQKNSYANLNESEKELLVKYALQQQAINKLASASLIKGKKELTTKIQEIVRKILKY